MIRNIFIIILLAGFSFILTRNYIEYREPTGLGVAAERYASRELSELGAQNIVTAVVVTYRGLDTLGEVTVLFLTASILGFFLKRRRCYSGKPSSEILKTASSLLLPFIILLGVYIAMNGHLTPGGGFQSGAVLASGLLLITLANPEKDGSLSLFSRIESFSGLAYVVVGLAGLILAGGFLDTTFAGLGVPGNLISAGAIPLVSVLIGMKVGAELSSMLVKMKNAEREE